MSQPSPDARAVVRALTDLTTQVKRIADTVTTTADGTDDDDATTPTTATDAPVIGTARIALPGIPECGPGCFCRRNDEQQAPAADGTLCGAPHHTHPETLCTEPAGHYRRQRDPHAGPLIIDGRQRGGAAWDEPEEDAQRTTRRNSLRNLIDYLDRNGALDVREGNLLRQHVEAEIREADTARRRAEQAERRVEATYRTVDTLKAELEQAQAAIKRVRALLAGRWGAVDPDLVRAALDGTEQPTTTKD